MVYAGVYHSIAKTSNGIWVFGRNNAGQLGPDALEEEYKHNINLGKYLEYISPPSKWKDEYSHVIGTPFERRFAKAKSARK